jgi:TM2 domain-containing membrane protein YozV
MKKLLTLFIFVFIGSLATQAGTSYHLDNAAIDDMFARAEVVEFNHMEPMAPLADMGYENQTYFESNKDPLVAFLLSWFLGYLGIHRAYLGTSTGTLIGYILTLGGCGIVATIDWIMLLIGLVNNDISQYIDNPKFFMW